MEFTIGSNIRKVELLDKVSSLSEQLTFLLIEKSDTLKLGYRLDKKYFSLVGRFEVERYYAFFEYEKIRRTIEIYQKALNHNETISEEKVNELLSKEIEEYEKKLKQVVNDYENAKAFMKLENLSKEDYKKVKETYRYIVKKIHPDLNPNLTDEYKVLWEMTQVAYGENNLNELLTIKEILDNKGIIAKKHDNEIEELEKKVMSLKASIDNTLLYISNIKKEHPFTIEEIINNKFLLEEKIEQIISETNEFKKAIKELLIHLDFVKSKTEWVC